MITRQFIKNVSTLSLAFIMAVSLFACTPKGQKIDSSHLRFDAMPSSESLISSASKGKESGTPAQNRALISFAGDCTFSNIQGLSLFNNVYDEEGPGYFLDGVSDIFAHDDLTIINLEGPFTTSTSQIDKWVEEEDEVDEEGVPTAFWFKAPPEYVQILTLGSVEVCNLANNHTMDYGYEGFLETEQVLYDAGIDYFAWDETLVVDVNGIKIGFFGLTYYFDPDTIYAAMDQLWYDGAEVIVAYVHDGIEGEYYPSYNQVSTAYTAIDYGASAVIMSHPHVIQGVEEYNGGFIAYSLGNFCYGGHTNPSDKDSMIVQLEFVRTDAGITCTPFVIPCSISSTSWTNDCRPMVLGGDEKQRLLDKIAELSS